MRRSAISSSSRALSCIHDPTSGVNKEFIKALDDARKGIKEYAEQVSLALIHQQTSSKEGSTFDTSTHNHNLLEAKQYYDILTDLKNRGIRAIGNEGHISCILSCGPPWLHLCY